MFFVVKHGEGGMGSTRNGGAQLGQGVGVRNRLAKSN